MLSHSDRFIRKFLSSIALILCVLPAPGSVAARQETPEHLSVIFILDDSGSMEGNDPGNLRYSAVRLCISVLDPGDRVGVIRFSTDSEPLTPGLVELTDADAKRRLAAGLTPPQKADGYTDVKAAFLQAEAFLRAGSGPDSNTVIILLTDGKPEIPEPYSQYEAEAIAAAVQLNAPVFAIALTPGGQSAFLTRLVKSTGGEGALARSAADLLDSYLQILGSLKDRTLAGQGSLQTPAESSISINPALAPYIQSVTFIASKSAETDIQLVDPSGVAVDPTSAAISYAMVDDPEFFVATVDQPAGGDWRFELTGGGRAQIRAILHSRLRTRIDLSDPLVEVGQPLHLEVSLWQETPAGAWIKIVGEAGFSALITRPDGSQESLDRFFDDGTHGDYQADDGQFTREYVNVGMPGTYLITVNGIKGMVPVAASTQAEADYFPEIIVDQPIEAQYQIRAEPLALQAHIEQRFSQLFEGGLLARVTAPSGKTSTVALVREQNIFSGDYTPVENGRYQISYEAAQASYRGADYSHQALVEIEIAIIANLKSFNPAWESILISLSISSTWGLRPIPGCRWHSLFIQALRIPNR